MTPAQVITSATRNAAQVLRLDDMGTIAPGKSADFIVLDANPLDDIHNSVKVRWVAKNGELYNGETLAREWPSAQPLPRFFWAE